MPAMDPSLSFVNDLLMEEGTEDASCLQEDGCVSYEAILRSFYDIIGDLPPLKDHVPSAAISENSLDLHSSDCIAVTNKQHVMSHNELNILIHQIFNSGAFREPLPAPNTFSQVPAAAAQHFDFPNFVELSALSTQDAFNFNDGKLMDQEDKALNPLRSCSGRGSNIAHFQLPSPYKQFCLNLGKVELLFENLKLQDHYADLYVGDPTMPTTRTLKHSNKEKGLVLSCKGGKSSQKRSADVHDYVDLRGMIVNCAEAVAVGNTRVANDILQQMRQVHGVSADGNGLQRAAHYFSEALVDRMRGTGGQHFRALQQQMPPAVAILKTYNMAFQVTPFIKLMHYFANQSILAAAVGASRLHIIDYGLEQGIQWPCLINALADRKGGPPLLVITGIGFPQPGKNPAETLEVSGRRLAAHARTYNVPFQYHAITSSKWEDLDASFFHFHEDEVLVVNCIGSLRHLADESVDLISPREKFFTSIRSLKPHHLITAELSAAYNSPFFVSRCREAVHFYSSMFDMMDTVWDGNFERLVKEKSGYYKDIVNIVACEGSERAERAETYKQWELRIKRAGFEPVLIPPAFLWRARSHMKQHYHKDFFVLDDANKWMLLGWKGRTSMAIAAWKLSQAQLSWNGS